MSYLYIKEDTTKILNFESFHLAKINFCFMLFQDYMLSLLFEKNITILNNMQFLKEENVGKDCFGT